MVTGVAERRRSSRVSIFAALQGLFPAFRGVIQHLVAFCSVLSRGKGDLSRRITGVREEFESGEADEDRGLVSHLRASSN